MSALALTAGAETLDASEYDQVLVFVHTNDVHGAVEVEPYVAAVAQAMEEEYGEDNVIVANAGDTWGGATIASLSNGEYIAPIMNAVGYDVMVLGNDNIARGTTQALKVAAMNDFATLSAGWVDAETGENLLDGTVIFDCGGVKVGIFGLTTPEIKPDSDWPTTMLDTQETAEACIQELKDAGCDVIVALTHLGFGEDYGFASMTLADSYEDVDLVIDGHSHTELPNGYQGAAGGLVVQTGQNGENIGVTKLYLKDGQVVGTETQLISSEEYTEQYTPDAEVSALVDYYSAIIEEQTSEVIGHTDVTLVGERAVVRVSETNLGDALTDAIRDYTGADMAIFPSALIRTSLTEGDLTLNDYLSVFGSGADIYVVTSTGAQLKEMLEAGLSVYPEQYMAFPQVSGICVTFAEGKPNTVESLTWADGTEIQDDDVFTLAIDLLFVDNFGIYDLTDIAVSVSGQTDMALMLANYMNSDSYSVPTGTGRVTLVDAVQSSFTDLTVDSWYYDAVLWAEETGITNGTTATTFSPEQDCTRAEIVTFLWRAAGSPAASDDVVNPFTDVDENTYYYQAMLWAYENHITNGTSATTFDPEAVCTRAQAVTFLWRLEGCPEGSAADSVADVDESAYYYDAVLWAVEQNITFGTEYSTDDTSMICFSPDETCTRAQIVTFLYRDLA
ncbi:MAG: S-layer homology domain-containing protein [Oscillospiraceae bacterium]|nr:S-layer homology domain-containing protein [Oscillospiraceae bacterium]